MLNKINQWMLTCLVSAVFVSCSTEAPAPIKPLAPAVEKPSAPKDGPQDITIHDGGRMTGMQENGKRVGPWNAYFANGTIRSKATYIEGKRNGPVEVFHENGMTYYKGQFDNELKVGKWEFFDPNGKKLKEVSYDSTGVMLK